MGEKYREIEKVCTVVTKIMFNAFLLTLNVVSRKKFDITFTSHITYICYVVYVFDFKSFLST